MSYPLVGTVALVTGTSSGIGQVTARRLAVDGAAVAVLARRADRLAELTAELRGAGAEAIAVPADVTDSK